MRIKAVATNAMEDMDFRVHLPNGRTDYLYVLFKTKTMLYVDNTFIPMNPGSGIFYDKNKIQSYYGCDEKEFNHDFLLFDLENEVEEKLFSSITKNKPLYHVNPDIISDAIHTIEREYTYPSSFKKEIVSNLGIVFLYRVLDELEVLSTTNKIVPHYKKFCELRREVYQKPFYEWTVEKMAKRLGFNRYYFQRLYKEFFKTTCINDVINARIDMAKHLLLRTDLSISDISEECGYENVEHFIRQFKKQVKITPKKFRKQI